MTVLLRNLIVELSEDEAALAALAERKLRLNPGSVRSLRIIKKSLDSRHARKPHFLYAVTIDLSATIEEKLLSHARPLVERWEEPAPVAVPHLPAARAGARPVIIGAGPAGLFAAHRLLAGGARPIVIERGPEVIDRAKRWHKFIAGGAFDPECNLLFGEGGAGAFSDGKLYTRVGDERGREVLQILAEHGAPPEILYDAKPHVGSNLLPSIIRKMRASLIARGAEFRFETRMVGVRFAAAGAGGSGSDSGGSRRASAVELEPGATLEADAIFLATGHSARDTYRMLHAAGIAMEQKAFQMGVRVEHPQPLVDRIQYGEAAGHARLPPAEYQYVASRAAGDVFSFCMCPGGEILPATEKAGFICVNGASRHKRTSPYANSGFVLTVETAAFPATSPDARDVLSGLKLQESVEAGAWGCVAECAAVSSAAPFAVPAARLTDFIAGALSPSLPQSSYPFPLVPARFDDWFPATILQSLREGFEILGKRIPGFVTDVAVVVGPESRSSSPVRIARDPVTLESPSARGLYPMGEGAGFAGGILSAAIDGMRCAESWLKSVVGVERA